MAVAVVHQIFDASKQKRKLQNQNTPHPLVVVFVVLHAHCMILLVCQHDGGRLNTNLQHSNNNAIKV